ncbi:hypothetical protein R4Y45_06165 [Holzapfeliella sp. He02]|uniref:Uncharacterized protein n=1 Tax=Holzapfeliella saturejae TaxID=3082953 RepID=A0ABU8SHE2_9LACO
MTDYKIGIIRSEYSCYDLGEEIEAILKVPKNFVLPNFKSYFDIDRIRYMPFKMYREIDDLDQYCGKRDLKRVGTFTTILEYVDVLKKHYGIEELEPDDLLDHLELDMEERK